MSADTLPETFAALAMDVSGHAREQWRERMPAGAAPIETALAESVRAHHDARHLFQTGGHPVPDGVLLYRGRAGGQVFGAVFIVQDLGPDAILRTTYRIQSRWDRSLRAYCWARLAEEADSI